MRSAVIVFVTTFVIIFPQFILKNHLVFANFLGVSLAVFVNCVFGDGWKL